MRDDEFIVSRCGEKLRGLISGWLRKVIDKNVPNLCGHCSDS